MIATSALGVPIPGTAEHPAVGATPGGDVHHALRRFVAPSLHAQQPPTRTPPPDSVRAAAFMEDAEAALRLLDSLALLDSLELLGPLGGGAATKHTVTLTAMRRGYTVGADDVTESSAPLRWRWTTARTAVTVAAAPLRFVAPSATLSGTTPVSGRLDWRLRPGDTLSVYGRTASRPATLDSTGVRALGTVGTSTLDLAGLALPTPAMVGVRGAFAFPVGDVVLGVGASVEYEPRPAGGDVTYWRGTTWRAETSVYGYAGDATWRVGAELARSNADTLGRRNLFPGGGQFVATASLEGPVGGSRLWGALDGFHLRAIDLDAAAQPNRLIPIGNFSGVTASAYLPIARLALLPSLSLLHESSTATATDGLVTTRVDGDGWSFTAGSVLDVPLGGGITLSPEAGLVVGGVGGRFAQAAVRRPRLARGVTFDDAVDGWYAGLSLTLRF